MILDCKKVAEEKKQWAAKACALAKEQGVVPTVAIILVGDDSMSSRYVRGQVKDCQEIGVTAKVISLPECVSKAMIIRRILALNEDPSVHGITVQLPLPKPLNHPISRQEILDAIAREKDVDGLRGDVLSRLAQGMDTFAPCTTDAILKILGVYNIAYVGKQVVVVGRSAGVGLPAALALQGLDASVSVVHSKTPEDVAKTLLKMADIVVLATGRGHGWNEEFFKDGAVIIDIGTSLDANGKLIGDFDDSAIKERGGDGFVKYTPLPGGVGLVTRASFVAHVVAAAWKQSKIES